MPKTKNADSEIRICIFIVIKILSTTLSWKLSADKARNESRGELES